MSLLSPRLQIAIKQKQILTPGLVQMVTVLQLNRLELKEMIDQEIAQNPVLEEVGEGGEELTPAEVQELLEAERNPEPADREVTALTREAADDAQDALRDGYDSRGTPETVEAAPAAESPDVPEPAASAEVDSFEQIDYDTYFDNWLDPGYRSPATEDIEKPSFETFLSSPITLTDHLRTQLSYEILPDDVRDATEAILGNLEDTGYLMIGLDEISASESIPLDVLERALKAVQSVEPGVGARSLQECLLLQLAHRGAEGGVAWQIVANHLPLVEKRDVKELARQLHRPIEHIEIALHVIRGLDPKPGIKYSGPGARQVAPDVYIFKDGDQWVIQVSDDDLPQLRLNGNYRRLLDREQEQDKKTRDYVRERFHSALQLIRNIEQRKQTILKVCQSIVERQAEFLEHGPSRLRPLMIKEVAEEIGVHASTVSRAVAGKYAHTPQGVFELRYFFPEAVQGPAGGNIPLQTLKKMVKKMIDEEDRSKPLTDDQLARMLQQQGIQVTRRTVAKYREDMLIPSTHQRRQRT
jgi:RNA polymerase sigma-54 factor